MLYAKIVISVSDMDANYGQVCMEFDNFTVRDQKLLLQNARVIIGNYNR